MLAVMYNLHNTLKPEIQVAYKGYISACSGTQKKGNSIENSNENLEHSEEVPDSDTMKETRGKRDGSMWTGHTLVWCQG